MEAEGKFVFKLSNLSANFWKRMRLEIRNFAQIESIDVRFGDLTVLVGPQASGKSLALQWFKFAVDDHEIINALRQAGHDVGKTADLMDLVFGEGMAGAWSDEKTKICLDEKPFRPTTKYQPDNPGEIFYIPAHRALLLAEGWPAPFQKLNADTPVVARLFSQELYQRFSGRKISDLFPAPKVLKQTYRTAIDQAVFHGGHVALQKVGLSYRLRLKYPDGVDLPFLAWTAGQREFAPLLLGLYHLLPSTKIRRRDQINWVIIEEPEMGLHPRAISGFMLLVLELLWRGYKVILSTHSPLILDIVWTIKRLAEVGAKWQLLEEAFEARGLQAVMQNVLNRDKCDQRVYFFNFENGRVVSKDISNLDPDSNDVGEAEWGGLTGFSTRFGVAVRKAVNEAEGR